MLKKIMLKKIAIASSLLIIMLMLYLIPTNEIELNNNQVLEYIYPNDLEVIYLLDNNNYLSRTKISVNNKNEISKAIDLIEGLTIKGKKKDIIPNGFKPLLPENTRILDISLKDKILKIDFSKEFNNVDINQEEQLIESLIYTLTSIEGIDKITIYIEGNKLNVLPKNKIKLPEYLDKSYGINKKYELTSLSDINSFLVY